MLSSIVSSLSQAIQNQGIQQNWFSFSFLLSTTAKPYSIHPELEQNHNSK